MKTTEVNLWSYEAALVGIISIILLVYLSKHTIKRDVIQVVFSSFNFFWVFLSDVPQIKQLLLSELCIVIESKFGIQAEDCNRFYSY